MFAFHQIRERAVNHFNFRICIFFVLQFVSTEAGFNNIPSRDFKAADTLWYCSQMTLF